MMIIVMMCSKCFIIKRKDAYTAPHSFFSAVLPLGVATDDANRNLDVCFGHP
jgi:hypothetical protein